MRRSLFASLLVLVSGCSLAMDTSPPDPTYTSLSDAGNGGTPCTDSSTCDDGDPCNGVETCGANGHCATGSPVVCPSTGCLVGVCQPDGSCLQKAQPAVCNDGVACTSDQCDKTSGSCLHQPDDTVCDDGFACTRDLCLGAAIGAYTGGCYSLPQDSLCEQPIGTANACLAMACAPGANSPNDPTGCVVRPLRTCVDGTRCNFDTAKCEPFPDGCVGGCDDGNPCNGVETCDTASGTAPVCVTTGGCPLQPINACQQLVCAETVDGPACGIARLYTSVCLAPTGP